MQVQPYFQPGLRWHEMVDFFKEESGGDERFLRSAKELAARRGWIYYEGTYWVFQTHRKAKYQVEAWVQATRYWLEAKQLLKNKAANAAFEEDWKRKVLHLRLVMQHLEELDPKTFKKEGWEPNEIDLLALMAKQEACGE